MPVRILVTGAAGFVGTHLARELEDHGHDVIAHRQAPTPTSALPGTGKALVEGTPPRVRRPPRPPATGGCSAATSPTARSAENTAATTELAAACAERAVPVLYASSSEVYGDHGTDTITEDSELRMPTTIYGLSKRWGEEACRLYLATR